MDTKDTGAELDITLRLETPAELFAAPPFDPFSARSRVESGMDEIADHLKTRRLTKPPVITVVLVLPKGYTEANDVPQISRAVERDCDLHIDRATIVKRLFAVEGVDR